MTVTHLPVAAIRSPAAVDADVRHRAHPRQHRDDGRPAAGRRADRVGGQRRGHQRQGAVPILAADVALASRVMKLANSAYFGMRGRVSSLQFAVTVVGFTTVRTMATVALTTWTTSRGCPRTSGVHDEPRAGRLHAGPALRRAPAGRAVHRPARPDGRRAAAPQRPRGLRRDRRRGADLRRPPRRRGAPLRAHQRPPHLGGPGAVGLPARDDAAAQSRSTTTRRWRAGCCARAFEVASRLTTEDYEPVPIVRLTCGHLREDDLVPILDQVRADADELRRAMLGD